MKFLCLKTSSIITEKVLRSTRHMYSGVPPSQWSEKAMSLAKARKIHDTPRPPVPEGMRLRDDGYEEIDGQLYQKWAVE